MQRKRVVLQPPCIRGVSTPRPTRTNRGAHQAIIRAYTSRSQSGGQGSRYPGKAPQGGGCVNRTGRAKTKQGTQQRHRITSAHQILDGKHQRKGKMQRRPGLGIGAHQASEPERRQRGRRPHATPTHLPSPPPTLCDCPCPCRAPPRGSRSRRAARRSSRRPMPQRTSSCPAPATATTRARFSTRTVEANEFHIHAPFQADFSSSSFHFFFKCRGVGVPSTATKEERKEEKRKKKKKQEENTQQPKMYNANESHATHLWRRPPHRQRAAARNVVAVVLGLARQPKV